MLENNVNSILSKEKDEYKKALFLKRVNKAKYLYDILQKARTVTKESMPSTSLLWEFVGSAENKIEPVGKIFNK